MSVARPQGRLTGKGPWTYLLTAAALLLVGVVGASHWLQQALQPAPAPPGWLTIRPPEDVMALSVAGEHVWAGGRDGVFKIERATGRVLPEPGLTPRIPYVRAVLAKPGGALWIGHEEGLTRYDGGSVRTFTEKDGLPGRFVTSLLEDSRGQLWAGTYSGAAVLTAKGWKKVTTADGLLDNNVNVIAEDQRGGLWFGSYVAPKGGVSVRRADGIWQTFAPAELPHNSVSGIAAIDATTVWVATGFFDRGGLAELVDAGGRWVRGRTITRRDGLAGEKVRSILRDRRGVVWCGSEYDGLAYFRDGRWRVIRERDGLANNEVKALAQDQAGDLWIGTRNGITRIGAQTLAQLP